LGGVVSATDVRAASKEQVESLGGRFVFVESNENLETAGAMQKRQATNLKKNKEELLKQNSKKYRTLLSAQL